MISARSTFTTYIHRDFSPMPLKIDMVATCIETEENQMMHDADERERGGSANTGIIRMQFACNINAL